MTTDRGKGYLFLIAVICFLIFSLQYSVRSLDDNRIVSWDSVFKESHPLNVMFVAVPAVIAVFIISGVNPGAVPGAFLLFAVSCAACIPFFRVPEMIVDASRYFSQAKALELYGPGYFISEWGRAIPAWTDMPVMPFIFGLIFRYAGEDRDYIQAATALIFGGSVVLTYLTGRKLWDREAGAMGGILLLGIPYIFSQSPLMLVDIPLMFFFLLSVYTFLLAMERGGWMVAVSAIAILLCFFTKYSSVLILTELPVIMVVYCTANAFKAESTTKTIIARGISVFLISAVTVIIIFTARSDVFSEQMRLLLGYQRPGLSRWGESFVSTFLFQVHPAISIAAACTLFIGIKRRDPKFMIVSWLVLMVFAFGIRRSRYIIPVFPMLALMASYGIMQVRHARIRKFIALTTVAFSLSVAFVFYRPYLASVSMVNIRDAGNFLDKVPGDDVELFMVYEEKTPVNPAVSASLLDIFTKRRIHYRYVPEDFRESRPRETSPLRFTWEYKNPDYYENADMRDVPSAVVVVSDKKDTSLPPDLKKKTDNYRSSRIFARDNDEFEFRTFVTVFYDPVRR